MNINAAKFINSDNHKIYYWALIPLHYLGLKLDWYICTCLCSPLYWLIGNASHFLLPHRYDFSPLPILPHEELQCFTNCMQSFLALWNSHYTILAITYPDLFSQSWTFISFNLTVVNASIHDSLAGMTTIWSYLHTKKTLHHNMLQYHNAKWTHNRSGS